MKRNQQPIIFQLLKGALILWGFFWHLHFALSTRVAKDTYSPGTQRFSRIHLAKFWSDFPPVPLSLLMSPASGRGSDMHATC